MSKYIFIKGYYDTLDLFSDEIIAELNKRGHSCQLIKKDSYEKDLKLFYKNVKDSAADAVIVFNNIGYNLGENEGGNVWDRLNIKYIDILVDHPFHFHSKLLELPKNSILFCVDKNHVNYIKKYYPRFQKVFFLPHAGCENEINKKRGLLKEAKKDIDIIYAGNLSRVFAENLIPDFDGFNEIDGMDFSMEVLEGLIKNPDRTTEDAICNALYDRGIKGDKNRELEYINAFRFVDGFAVSYFRELSVRILVDNGFKVTVLGDGWEKTDWCENKNLKLLGKVEAKDVIAYMLKSKIVLNTMTWFKAGAHDRIFNGALCKAHILTDASKYLSHEIKEERGISFFDLKEIDSVLEKVERALKNYNINDISDGFFKLCNDKHTWANRIDEILSII